MHRVVYLKGGPRHGRLVEVQGPYLKVERLVDEPPFNGKGGLRPLATEIGYYRPALHRYQGYDVWAFGGWNE